MYDHSTSRSLLASILARETTCYPGALKPEILLFAASSPNQYAHLTGSYWRIAFG
jgi:hypothetical protein